MDSCFHIFEGSTFQKPKVLNNPFYYKPSALGLEAFDFVVKHLLGRSDLKKFFDSSSIGKMIGFLLVENAEKQLGILVAFSGKIDNRTDIEGFVPPIFNTLNHEGFYKIGEAELDLLTAKIRKVEADSHYLNLQKTLLDSKRKHQAEIEFLKMLYKESKAKRSEIRLNASEEAKAALDRESATQQIEIKTKKRQFKNIEQELELEIERFEKQIENLKSQRKLQSQQLQNELFDAYYFVNEQKERASLLQIFRDFGIDIPPSGAGECAAPKLFNHAFLNQYKPIELLEFWWGPSPNSRIRKSGHFYPACRSKCEPILGFMLSASEVQAYEIPTEDSKLEHLEILFEDDFLAAINKPANVLTVKGKGPHRSVEDKLQTLFPNAKNPKLVHRLDRGTSGVLLVAKTDEAYKELQSLFLKREISKKYIAILDGLIDSRSGTIKLPLRVDLDNRPQQMVCFQNGLEAETKFEVHRIEGYQTHIFFYPKTGRTHQLRVHAAHYKGLNCPILGDDLYGKGADRLYLHAGSLTFLHPFTQKRITLYAPTPW